MWPIQVLHIVSVVIYSGLPLSLRVLHIAGIASQSDNNISKADLETRR
jgi:hypothetical protein